jgi:hypothetical protein
MQNALAPQPNSAHSDPNYRQQLEHRITELAAHIHAATFRLLELIREFDEIEGWAGPGLNSCAHWLNWKCGINLGAAREKVRVAHALKGLPKISEKFRLGEVSYSKVRAMTRVATKENEDFLEQQDVSAETSRRLCCDSSVVHWLEDKKGEPLSVGRKTRTIPPATRHALQRRDQGCRFPGCTCTRFVDAHHIRHWADGGETNLDNLVLLCRRHHRLVHEGGFAVRTNPDGQFQFTDPQGRVVPQAGDGRFRGNVFALMTEHDRSGIHITRNTGRCRWQGERMDDDLAILGMLQLE